MITLSLCCSKWTFMSFPCFLLSLESVPRSDAQFFKKVSITFRNGIPNPYPIWLVGPSRFWFGPYTPAMSPVPGSPVPLASLLFVPRIHWIYSCLRDFEFTVSSAWNTSPLNICWLLPSFLFRNESVWLKLWLLRQPHQRISWINKLLGK